MDVQENKPQELLLSSEQLHEVDGQQLKNIRGGGMCQSRPKVKVPAPPSVLPVANQSGSSATNSPRLCSPRYMSLSSLLPSSTNTELSFSDWLPKPGPTLKRSLSLDS